MQKVLFQVLLCLLILGCNRSFDLEKIPVQLITIENFNEIPPLPALDKHGFEIGEYSIEEKRIKRNENLHLILSKNGVSPEMIYQIQREAVGVVDLRKMIPGQKFYLYKPGEAAAGFVWYQSPVDFVTMKWTGEKIEINRDAVELTAKEKSFSGSIKTSLYDAINDGGASRLLGQSIADVYAWEIDFFSLRKGDSFKVIYDELYAGDELYGAGRVKAAQFTHRGIEYKAYYFENDEVSGFYDENGNSIEKALLKAPFKYSQRVSSGFSHNRLHPILNQRRPHYGVDYAARPGTPILAVGDGTVTEAQYRGGNGNIVQIRHNSTYKTAYLHMQRFADGIKPGVRVKQGQVIGYVGSSGLATGPHLCYRLYKNSQPVNSLNLQLPSSDALEDIHLGEFMRMKETMDKKLEEIDAGDKLAYSN